MAPLPHNNTDLVYVDYTSGNLNHTFEVRVDTLGEIEAIETVIGAFLVAVGNLVSLGTITAVRGQNAASDVSFPFPISSLVGTTFGSGTAQPDQRPFFINFVGRSTGGRRVSLALYTFVGALSQYRLINSEESEIGAATAILNGSTGTFLAIDGLQPFWYPYANTGVNAYYQRKTRN